MTMGRVRMSLAKSKSKSKSAKFCIYQTCPRTSENKRVWVRVLPAGLGDTQTRPRTRETSGSTGKTCEPANPPNLKKKKIISILFKYMKYYNFKE